MVWLVTMIDWDEAFRMMKEGSPFYFVLAFLAIQITVATSIWKWKMLIESSEKNCNDHSIPTYLGKLYYIGLFFNNFMPGSVGGDVVRIYYLGKRQMWQRQQHQYYLNELQLDSPLLALC